MRLIKGWIAFWMAGLGLLGMTGATAQEEPPAMPVEAVAAELGTVSLDVTAVGTLRADEAVMIRPEIPGRITKIHFTEGEAVAEGQELITLDASEYRAQLAESSATVKLNRLNFERAKDLIKKKLMSQQEYDEAMAQLLESEARQAVDEVRLAKTVLRAPFSGILGLRLVSPGDYVQPGQDIVTLEAVDPVKLDFRIPELHTAQVKPGQPVAIRLDAFPERVFEGKVYAIAPRLDEQTRTLLLRARVPNPQTELKPGMFARVTLELGSRQAVLIPEEAVVPTPTGTFVYRVIEGKAAMTEVALGQRRTGVVEVRKGLEAGELVITAGQLKIVDGMPVTVIETGEPQRQAQAPGR